MNKWTTSSVLISCSIQGNAEKTNKPSQPTPKVRFSPTKKYTYMCFNELDIPTLNIFPKYIPKQNKASKNSSIISILYLSHPQYMSLWVYMYLACWYRCSWVFYSFNIHEGSSESNRGYIKYNTESKCGRSGRSNIYI